MSMALTTTTTLQHTKAAAASSRHRNVSRVSSIPRRTFAASSRCPPTSLHIVRATSSDNPVRQALSGLASSIYKATASMKTVDSSLPALWQGLEKLDLAAVQAALRNGADPNETNAQGETPLLYIAREGHYKFPPNEIPALLIQSGADMEAKDANGRTALQVSLLAGWQNIAGVLIKSGAQTGGIPAIKASITCPDCKQVAANY